MHVCVGVASFNLKMLLRRKIFFHFSLPVTNRNDPDEVVVIKGDKFFLLKFNTFFEFIPNYSIS